MHQEKTDKICTIYCDQTGQLQLKLGQNIKLVFCLSQEAEKKIFVACTVQCVLNVLWWCNRTITKEQKQCMVNYSVFVHNKTKKLQTTSKLEGNFTQIYLQLKLKEIQFLQISQKYRDLHQIGSEEQNPYSFPTNSVVWVFTSNHTWPTRFIMHKFSLSLNVLWMSTNIEIDLHGIGSEEHTHIVSTFWRSD